MSPAGMALPWQPPRAGLQCFQHALLLVAALLLAGCGFNRELARQAEARVGASRPSQIDCDRADHCALASPYHELAERTRSESTAAQPVHYANVLERGEDALLLRVHLIRAARRTIDLQTYLWSDDEAGWLILDELIAAARRGVRVRVLADQLFSLDRVDWLARIARAHANFELRLYNPTFSDAVTPPLEFAAGVLCCFQRFNQRMHNKLLLIDGEIGIAGGRNIQNRYFDWDDGFNYRDRDLLVVGPAAGRQMQASFEQFWTHPLAVPLTHFNDVNRRLLAETGEHGPPRPPRNADPERLRALRARADDIALMRAAFAGQALRVGAVDYFSDAPGKQRDGGTRHARDLGARIAELLAAAESEVVFETPYLVLSRRARGVFRSLQKREEPVRVVVSTNSLAATDAFFVYALSYKYKKRYLKRYGFSIHEFKPFPADAARFVAGYPAADGGEGTTDDAGYRRYGRAPLARRGMRLGLHSKSLVIDGRISLIGSHNFDPRSDHYNTESGFIIDERSLAAKVRGAILLNADPANAWTIAPRRGAGWLEPANRAVGDVSAALPLFDLWPLRYSSSFELKPGCRPLPSRDPRFHDCYVDVGDFPEVALPLMTIYTRIVTAFGAGLAGIL